MAELVAKPMPKVIAASLPRKLATQRSSSTCLGVVPADFSSVDAPMQIARREGGGTMQDLWHGLVKIAITLSQRAASAFPLNGRHCMTQQHVLHAGANIYAGPGMAKKLLKTTKRCQNDLLSTSGNMFSKSYASQQPVDKIQERPVCKQ